MDDDLRSPDDPRWGQENREAKADAIVRTLQLHCGGDLPRGQWLDIGCGSGGIAASLTPFADKVVGADPESWERWNAYRECHPNLEFHIGGYRDLTKLLEANRAMSLSAIRSTNTWMIPKHCCARSTMS
jgi:hypothetical protein